MDFSYASSTYSQAISTKTLQNKDETHIKICVSELRTYLECINKNRPGAPTPRRQYLRRDAYKCKNIVSSSGSHRKQFAKNTHCWLLFLYLFLRKEDDYVG